MDLSKRCAAGFDSRDWSRGAQYFRNGAVSVLEHGPTGIQAEVEGTAAAPYRVWLDWSDVDYGALLVNCSCPRFDDVGQCKHVAAAILAVDAQDIGGKVPGKGPLFLEPAEVDPDEFDDRSADDSNEADRGHDVRDQRHGNGVTGGLPDRINPQRGMVTTAANRERGANWKKPLAFLAELNTRENSRSPGEPGSPWSRPREIWYLLDVVRTSRRGWPCISLWQRPIKKDGTPGKLKAANLSQDEAHGLASAEDRTLLGMLVGNERDTGFGYRYDSFTRFDKLSDFAVAPALFDVLLPRLCASGRFGWLPEVGSTADEQIRPLAWDDGPPWKLRLNVSKSSDQKHWQVSGKLQRSAAVEDLSTPLILLAAGLVIFPDRIARFDAGNDFRWVAMLREFGTLNVPVKQEQEFVEQLAQFPSLPQVEWPEELRWEEERVPPSPHVRISKSKHAWTLDLECRLTFQYGDSSAPFGSGQSAWYDRRTRRAVRRDLDAETAARDQLLAAGAQRPSYFARSERELYIVAPAKMPRLVHQLTTAGWHVEAQGHVIRRPGQLTISVTSGVDWFDLEGACDFEGVTASFPSLLAAVSRGDLFVQLDDGSQGMLPEEWLSRYAPLAELGQAEGDRLRFVPAQGALLDALLAAQESAHVTVDKGFARLRDKLRSFDGVRPRREPRSFVGELRAYQREGLGWLYFLDEFGFGGCLADDMGLGKTVQILAFLDGRRTTRRRAHEPRKKSSLSPGPSLVVVPRSLVFNWIDEANRFTPQLRVLNYTGLDRRAALDRLNDYDLVVTTYGTLRRDIAKLRNWEFDCAILDEAQAIKNASSQAAKACRLLRAVRRLAMTGTPVENHLGEIWSLFEFLNPGMLGRQRKLNDLFAAGRPALRVSGEPQDDPEPTETRTFLARTLRPFLLRRTKQQVLSELPAKIEQTLYCELGGDERARYAELRDHYRRALTDRVGKVGLNKSKIQVLEALLRLRQAACHPGLLDKKQIDAESAKLETLLEQLTEVIEEGHKALVFSQFTSFLAIVRRRLDRRKIDYEYLDGRTVKRKSKVQRFQSDPACRLFLISLKAGGHGLNLTAADYVFILDPWWNPAVEAQAVDRAHRMGQERRVFAYRLIARDTVEEKILQLQDHKRGLADAIVSADNSVLRNLTADDLQLLLS